MTIDEIVISAGYRRGLVAEGKDVVTDRGIHLGDPFARVKARYHIAFSDSLGCIAPPPARAYYAHVGGNLIAFDIHAGVVAGITLLGPPLRSC